MKVLLTNDDGITADGIQVLRAALAEIPGIELVTIAPDTNRSAIGRGITIRRSLRVVKVADRQFETDGTPTDCVRLAGLGLVDGFYPDVVVSGINHGLNAGDDVTYSGTVGAAMEGLMLDRPAIAVSQQAIGSNLDFHEGASFRFDVAAAFVARLVAELDTVQLPAGTLLNVNVPAEQPTGVEVCRLGKRVYGDELRPDPEDPDRVWMYGEQHTYVEDPGTDLHAIVEGRIAVTPLHLDLTHHDGIGPLSRVDLDRLLAPAAEVIE